MIDDLAFGEIQTFGDPWHGLVVGSTLTLPGGITRSVPGASPVGGDCYVVQVPGQPAVATPPADAALGMTWLNYGLMSGQNHCIYGVALGENSWLYIDAAGAAWLAAMTFNVATGVGSVAFKRFGVFPDDGAGVVQTASFSVSGPFSGSAWQIDDIKSGGDGVLVVAFEPYDVWPGVSGMATAGFRDVGGALELTISGTPPAAIVSAVQLADQSQAGGEYVDTRVTTSVLMGTLSIKTSNVGRNGHSNKLFGYCYSAGVATPVLRSLWSDQESYSSPVDAGGFLVDYTTSGEAEHVYEIKIGTQVLQITGHTDWAGSGRIDRSYDPPLHLSGHLVFNGVVNGHAGFTYAFDDDAVNSFQAQDSWIFTDAGDTDNYTVWTHGTSDPTMAIWPKRLGNGLYGLCRYQRDLVTNAFGGTHLSGVISPAGVTAANASNLTNDGAEARASRQPVDGSIHYQLTADGSNVCWR